MQIERKQESLKWKNVGEGGQDWKWEEWPPKATSYRAWRLSEEFRFHWEAIEKLEKKRHNLIFTKITQLPYGWDRVVRVGQRSHWKGRYLQARDTWWNHYYSLRTNLKVTSLVKLFSWHCISLPQAAIASLFSVLPCSAHASLGDLLVGSGSGDMFACISPCKFPCYDKTKIFVLSTWSPNT